ncbi:hypothetical protein Esti_002701 [Eimeria stiedai]
MIARQSWGRLKSVLPDAEHPAASQPTPLGLNRYALLGIYMTCTLLSSCTYLGWGPLTTILFRNRAFIWVCSAEDQANDGSSGSAACTSQDVDVQNLFTITYSVHFSATAIAGFLSDTAGPKVTATLGQTLNLCGWALLGACSDTFRALLPAFVLIGAGAGMSYLPMLCIVHLFPGSTGFCLTTMGAACSLGLLVTLVMNLVNASGLSFHWVMWNYAVLGPAFSLGLVVVFVPLNGFIEVDRFVLVGQMMSPIGSATLPQLNPRGRNFDARLFSSPRRSPSPIQPLEEEDRALSSMTDDDFFLPFRKEACTFLHFGLCIYFGICSVVMNYYQKASGFLLSAEAFKSLELALPLSIIPCLILGRVSDYISIAWVMIFVNAAGALSYLLAVVDKPGGVVSVAFFSIYVGLFSSQVYIFVLNLFTSSHFGKLAGIVNMLGGVASLLSNQLYGSKHDSVMWGLFATMCAAFVLLLFMAFEARRKQRSMKAAQVLKDGNMKSDSLGSNPSLKSSLPLDTPTPGHTPPSRPQNDSLYSASIQPAQAKTFAAQGQSFSAEAEDDRLSFSVPLSP